MLSSLLKATEMGTFKIALCQASVNIEIQSALGQEHCVSGVHLLFFSMLFKTVDYFNQIGDFLPIKYR